MFVKPLRILHPLNDLFDSYMEIVNSHKELKRGSNLGNSEVQFNSARWSPILFSLKWLDPLKTFKWFFNYSVNSKWQTNKRCICLFMYIRQEMGAVWAGNGFISLSRLKRHVQIDFALTFCWLCPFLCHNSSTVSRISLPTWHYWLNL